ncbi:unnamed protein product [Plutella xylostella]|uniref:(diamondback moth) hypothetical protein n=1 Tax=Plutella xylostella TaxID=51655 RepID=A0A8S4FB93_PLUXY|nr:unnamed protein product [Plutella xylostella]
MRRAPPALPAAAAATLAALSLLLRLAHAGSMGPGVPENITVTFLNPTTVRVSWSTAAELVEKYDVTYKPSDARVVLEVAGNSDAVVLSGLEADTQYQVTVAALWSGRKFRSRPIVFRTLGTLLDRTTLAVAIRLRLRLQTNKPHRCRCGEHADRRGHHGLSCGRSAGRIARHAALNDTIRRALARANVPATLEPSGIMRDDGKRPDEAGAAAGRAETMKGRKYASLGEGYMFVPFGVETLGPWGPEARRLLKEIVSRLKEVTRDPRAGSYLAQRISIAIQREPPRTSPQQDGGLAGTARPSAAPPDPSPTFPTIRGVEIGIVVMVLLVWIGAIALFFNRWGKIRMLLPYQPDYKQEQLKVPGSSALAAAQAGGTCGAHSAPSACSCGAQDVCCLLDRCFQYPRRSARDCGCQFALLHAAPDEQAQGS